MPWSLELAHLCTNMVDSTLIHLPITGSVLDQPKLMLDCLECSRRVWYIVEFKPTNRMPVTADDDSFMEWVHEKP